MTPTTVATNALADEAFDVGRARRDTPASEFVTHLDNAGATPIRTELLGGRNMTRDPHSAIEILVPSGPKGFFTVRYVRAAGTDQQIGRALATAARDVLGPSAGPHKAADATVERARRRWFGMHHPSLRDRTAGIAEVFGVDPDDDTWDLARLGRVQVPAGCSAVFLPGCRTDDGHARLGRNFDFPTTTYSGIMGALPMPGEPPLAADPWVIELHPDHGCATIVVGIMDMMGGMDGINEAGLAVTLLADNETPEPEPTVEPQVGLSEQQIVRYVLETCRTAIEAKEALLLAKQYYLFVPCHFLVADRSGRSFIWEYSPGHNREHIVEPGASGHLICTNHLLHRWPDPNDLPTDPAAAGTAAFTYDRWRTLSSQVSEATASDASDMRRQLDTVRFAAPTPGVRTLWQAIYDLDEPSIELSFFTRDTALGSEHTQPIRFELSPEPQLVLR